MKKLFTVTLLAGLLSIPSVVFAEASWYGSIRTGIESNSENNTGVADFSSRWGVKGSAEAAEGLTAVYRYERKINSTNADDPGGRLSYVGLSGGFGTLTVGQVWGAAYNHFGGIVDQGLNYSSPGATGYRFGNAVSYAVSVGSVSLQADAIMDQSTKKSGDGFNFGATMGVGESGKVAVAHRKHQDMASDMVFPNNNDTPTDNDYAVVMAEKSSSFIAGSYGIGDMTVFLGYSQDKWEDDNCTAAGNAAGGRGQTSTCDAEMKTKTTYAGVHGGVGDTGVSYVFTMRTAKSDTKGFGDGEDTPGEANMSSDKNTPWTLGLARGLGGGATLKFEHSDPDSDSDKASTALWLQVNF